MLEEEDVWVSKDEGVYLRGQVGWFPEAYAERVSWDYLLCGAAAT